MPPASSPLRQLLALAAALVAMAAPLAGMTLVSLSGPAYVPYLENWSVALLVLSLVGLGGTAAGLALVPSFFLGAVCGYLLPGPWPYIAIGLALAWATALGLGLGRLFSTNFLEVLLQRKTAWWETYQRLCRTQSSFLATAIVLLRLAPHMPFALTNLACAKLPLKPVKIWLASYIGLLPRTLFATHIGAQLQDWRTLLDLQRPPWELILSVALMLAFVILSRKAARRLESHVPSGTE
jgi:uncharacterized membrane protein YdjX (TVP38/TMEM64 family)